MEVAKYQPKASTSLIKVIDDEAKFFFRPYTYTPRGMFTPKTFMGPNEEI